MKTLHFEQIDSTNTYLKQNYQRYENYTFVSADYQSSGKGRENRIWDSEPKVNLLFSLLIKDETLLNKYQAISMLSAYTIIQVLKAYGLSSLSIKWPNDVYCQGNKIAGILLEGVSQDKLKCLIVGVGLNVNQKVFAYDYKRQPSSIYLQLHREIDLDLLKEQIYQQFVQNLNQLKEKDCFYDKISELNYLKDKEVTATINNQEQSVKVLAINKDYSLRIETDHQVKDIESGEITFHM